MELYILRHGTTAWNEKHLLQGQSDIPLDEAGRRLALETGEGMNGLTFDFCYSSPLLRAIETAVLVMRGREAPVIPDWRLAEMNFGDFEGMDCSPKDRDYNPELGRTLAFDIRNYHRPPHGESMEALLGRTAAFFKEITENPDNENRRILISTHGGAGRALMHAVWGGEDFWHGSVPRNCTVCIVRISRGHIEDVRQDVQFYHSEVKDFYG